MKFLIVVLFVALLTANIWVFLIKPRKPWPEKIALVLQIVGVYTFAFGILAQTKIFEKFGTLAQNMTSPNLLEFMAGNFHFLAIFFSTLAVALEPTKVAYGPLYFLGMIVLLVFAVLGFVYAAIHILVIMPLSYIAYLLASVPFNAVVTSASDIAISVGDDTVSIKAVVSSNSVSVKNFLIAIPALATALAGKIFFVLRRIRQDDDTKIG